MSENIFLGKWRIVESIPCSDENYSKTCSPREATPPLNHEDTPLLRHKGASPIKSTNPEVFALLVSHNLHPLPSLDSSMIMIVDHLFIKFSQGLTDTSKYVKRHYKSFLALLAYV